MATIFPIKVVVLLCTVFYGVLSMPLDPLPGKSGEDQVKEAVHKAELAARNAALQNGNSAQLRVAAIKAKLDAQHAMKQHTQRAHKSHSKLKSLRKWGHPNHLNNHLKSYNHQPGDFLPMLRHHFRRPRHRNTLSKMITLNDLASDTASPTNYKEDTTLEDRLALEVEEDKKFTNSDNDIYGSSRSFLSSKDATQSIQNQVASESARELKEIQQQINAESQNSLGKTSMGASGALFQGNPSAQRLGQQKPTTRNGMMSVQSDLNNAFTNAEGQNTNSNIMSPQISNSENDIGANAFTGLGELKQSNENNQMNSNMAGISQMANPALLQSDNERMGEGQATMESPQGEIAQTAASALAAGAGQAAVSNSQSMIPSDVGGLGGPSSPLESMGIQDPGNIKAADGGDLQGGNSLGGEEMMPGGSMESNSFGGGSMKKSKINDLKRVPSKQ